MPDLSARGNSLKRGARRTYAQCEAGSQKLSPRQSHARDEISHPIWPLAIQGLKRGQPLLAHRAQQQVENASQRNWRILPERK